MKKKSFSLIIFVRVVFPRLFGVKKTNNLFSLLGFFVHKQSSALTLSFTTGGKTTSLHSATSWVRVFFFLFFFLQSVLTFRHLGFGGVSLGGRHCFVGLGGRGLGGMGVFVGTLDQKMRRDFVSRSGLIGGCIKVGWFVGGGGVLNSVF